MFSTPDILHKLTYFNDCKTKKELTAKYHKLLLKYHPDKSKTKTTDIFLEIKAEYEHKLNNEIQLDERFPFLSCRLKDVENLKCSCGSVFNIENMNGNRIDCDWCSLFILII